MTENPLTVRAPNPGTFSCIPATKDCEKQRRDQYENRIFTTENTEFTEGNAAEKRYSVCSVASVVKSFVFPSAES